MPRLVLVLWGADVGSAAMSESHMPLATTPSPSSGASVLVPSWVALRPLASPWVSLAWLLLIFIHETIGSAFFFVRQTFELTEMEWFNGPLSAVLWGGLCLNMILASLVRVPWVRSRMSSHLTHLSVVLMVVSCGIYFGNKFEGEALITRHVVEVTDSQGNHARLLPNPGFAVTLGDATAKIQTVIPRWAVLTPDGKSQQAWAVMVSLQCQGGRKFTATVIEGRPELTQYTCEGRIPDSYLADVAAVVTSDGVVRATDKSGVVRVAVKAVVGERAQAGDWSLEITDVTPDWPLLAEGYQGQKGTMVAFTMHTPLGQQSGSSIMGLPPLTRYQRARMRSIPDQRIAAVTLVDAPTTRAYHQDRFAVWVRPVAGSVSSQPRSYDVLPLSNMPRYREHGTALGADALDLDAGKIGETHFTVTGFAPYAVPVSLTREEPSAPLKPSLQVTFSDGASEPIERQLPLSADITELDHVPLVWFRCADQAQRDSIVAELNRRYPSGGTPPPQRADATDVRVVFITQPDQHIEVISAEPVIGVVRQPVTLRTVMPLTLAGQRLSLQVNGMYEHPVQEVVPMPVPLEQRQSRMSVGMSQAWIQVQAKIVGGETVSRWVGWTPFPELPEELGQRDTVLGGYAPKPAIMDVPGMGRVEILFSRVPFDLPGPVWMTKFHVPRRPGVDDPMEFFCDVNYGDVKNPASATIHMNEPLDWDGTFFFQAGWDPQTESLSILGVGNRPAGWFMLLSAILLGVGMTWSGMGKKKIAGEQK